MTLYSKGPIGQKYLPSLKVPSQKIQSSTAKDMSNIMLRAHGKEDQIQPQKTSSHGLLTCSYVRHMSYHML